LKILPCVRTASEEAGGHQMSVKGLDGARLLRRRLCFAVVDMEAAAAAAALS